VKGAASGAGLGNKFLSHIREVDAILHVLRCFEDDDITHVHGSVDPVHDAEIIEMELILADLESVEKRIASMSKRVKSGDKAAKAELDLLNDCMDVLSKGKPVRSLEGKYSKQELKAIQLLTSKPILYACNVLEEDAVNGNELCAKVAEMAARESAGTVIISSKIEAEISSLESNEEKAEFLDSLGLKE